MSGLLFGSAAMAFSDNKQLSGGVFGLGLSALAVNTWGDVMTPDSAPERYLLDLNEREKASFTRGYDDQMQARRSEHAWLGVFNVGLSVLTVCGMIITYWPFREW